MTTVSQNHGIDISTIILCSAVEITSADDPLSPAILLDLKRIEADNLKEAIQQVSREFDIQ